MLMVWATDKKRTSFYTGPLLVVLLLGPSACLSGAVVLYPGNWRAAALHQALHSVLHPAHHSVLRVARLQLAVGNLGDRRLLSALL